MSLRLLIWNASLTLTPMMSETFIGTISWRIFFAHKLIIRIIIVMLVICHIRSKHTHFRFYEFVCTTFIRFLCLQSTATHSHKTVRRQVINVSYSYFDTRAQDSSHGLIIFIIADSTWVLSLLLAFCVCALCLSWRDGSVRESINLG